ncbi:unnamed protein product [Schistosoma rodhaini]|uniref:Uncharacterized protein n=1 Tax=Schistosoma rodhaini TaxID=6188 RepID=A0AA85FKD7_9TREM|nr:unnamed protein product [Schistosoma rodhaini]
MLTGLEFCLFDTVVGFSDLSYRKICIPLSVVSLSHLGLIQYSLWNQGFYNVFFLQPSSSVSSLPLTLWYIFISDCSLKMLSIFIKTISLLSLSKTLDCYSMVCIILSLCKEFMKFSRSMICTKPYTVELQAPSNEVCNMCLESYTHIGILSCNVSQFLQR